MSTRGLCSAEQRKGNGTERAWLYLCLTLLHEVNTALVQGQKNRGPAPMRCKLSRGVTGSMLLLLLRPLDGLQLSAAVHPIPPCLMTTLLNVYISSGPWVAAATFAWHKCLQ
jgi:hypothetical protein